MAQGPLRTEPETFLFWQREDEEGVSGGRPEHAGQEPFGPSAPPDRHGDVLPSVDAVGSRAAVVAASALELPQQLPGAGVDRVELPRGFTGEHQIAARGERRRAHRKLVAPAPLLLSACIERANGPCHVLDVHLNARAPVRDALLELPAPPSGRCPGILHRDVEQARFRAVGRVRPFLRTGWTRVEVDGLALLIRVLPRGHLAVAGDDAPVDPVHERRYADALTVRAVQHKEVPVLIEV